MSSFSGSSLRNRISSKARGGTQTAEEKNNLTQLHSNVSESKRESRNSSLLPFLLLMCWISTISYFLIRNYSHHPWPSALLSSNRDMWRLVHAISSMMFGGTIILSTIIEWLVVLSKALSVLEFWFTVVPTLDGAIVLPALTGTLVSGVAQATQDYGSLREAPKYIIGSLHVLLTFAIWWVMTDVTTQHASRQAVTQWRSHDNKQHPREVPRVLLTRRWSNVGSCIFVIALYTLMAFKPGHATSDD